MVLHIEAVHLAAKNNKNGKVGSSQYELYDVIVDLGAPFTDAILIWLFRSAHFMQIRLFL